MKDREYYDYSKMDDKEAEYRKEIQAITDKESTDKKLPSPDLKSEGSNPKTTENKKRGCYGCTIVIISIIMVIVGIATIIIAHSTAYENSVKIKPQGKKTVIVENVDPDNKFRIKLKVNISGNHYYKEYKNDTRKSLVHQIPYSIKAIRESNGDVVYELEDKFELGTDKEIKKQKKKTLINRPSFSKSIPKFDFTDKVRFELVLHNDEKYKSKVKSGKFSVIKMSAARNVTWQVASLITVLGFLGVFIGFIATIIQFFILAGKGKLNNGKSIVESTLSDGSSPEQEEKGVSVAQKVSWAPAKKGGTSICTHKLCEVSLERLEFKARLLALLFPLSFMGAGVFIIVATINEGLGKGNATLWVGPIIGLAFFLSGFFMMRSWLMPRVFDKDKRLYWKGWKAPFLGIDEDKNKNKKYCDLKDIQAIQIIRERVRSHNRSGSRSYNSYELNIVLSDGSRINVVDHGNGARLRSDAKKLAEFLGVPLLDSN